jgi:hypothetical protein
LHRKRTLLGFSRVAKPALAGLLALILIFAATVSVSQTVHRFLHHDASASGHFCLICSIAKGQVSAAAVATIPAPPVISCFSSLPATDASVLRGFDYRLSPSRAPPAPVSFLSVAA